MHLVAFNQHALRTPNVRMRVAQTGMHACLCKRTREGERRRDINTSGIFLWSVRWHEKGSYVR